MDREQVNKVLKSLINTVGGDWVLLGGALVQMAFKGHRPTQDIDLVHLTDNTLGRRQLMELAQQMGLPFEALNSAADFFLSRFPNWEKHLVSWMSGSKGNIFRPKLTLFLAMKLARGSEADLDDCKQALKEGDPNELDRKTLESWLKTLTKDLPKDSKAFLKNL